MKRSICEILMAVVLAWVVPWFLVSAVISAQQVTVPDESAAPTEDEEKQMHINVKTKSGVVSMTLDDYLTAVLLAELPGSFHMEAKMAQAVVARTYALRTAATTDKHPGAVCCESGCCQGYCPPEDYIKAGGQWETVEQAREAVRLTGDWVLTYDGSLIDATYFACSGGYTEPAVAVWGRDVPYLQAVPSPGEESAAHYADTVTMTPEDFSERLGIRLAGSAESWLGSVTYTQGGGVAWMVIDGRRFSGTQLRKLLDLRSTAFSITVNDSVIRISTKGHGHRVGMSQYGAQAMALSGSTWQQILAHYYPKTQIAHSSGK